MKTTFNFSLLLLMGLIMFSFTGGEENTVTDIDGRVYKTVKIGNQIWMTENLNVSRYRNGDTIFQAKTTKQWSRQWNRAEKNFTTMYCYYGFDTANGRKYGKLYNHYAVVDPRGLAPEGWHVASDSEYTVLTNYLEINMKVLPGKSMKSTSGWNDRKDGKSGNGDNSSGFAGLPGGQCDELGLCFGVGQIGAWWASEPLKIRTKSSDYALNRELGNNGEAVGRSIPPRTTPEGNGLSVRCVKDN